MKHNLRNILTTLAAVVLLGSCAKKLDLFPQNDLTPEKAYSTPEGYKAVLAKIYGGLAITGNQGPAGQPDIQGGLDEGSHVAFIRGFFNLQELPTDEAVVSWNDQTIQDFHNLRWTAGDPFLRGMYARPIYNITLGNEYLRESTDEKLAERGITGTAASDIKTSRGEVRFLRAFNYWVMLDLFGRSTFVTEANEVGSALPPEIKRPELFAYIESELKAIETELAAPKTAEYGRVDQAAAWALLARLYLNAKVYTGTERYADAMTYANKVIAGPYALVPGYSKLFMADNDKHRDEIIWAINCDGFYTQAYGNTSFLIHAPASEDFSEFGANEGWGGYRATKGLADKFADLTGATDQRAMFTTSKFGTSASQIQITNVGDFSNGLHVKKYINIRSDGQPVHDPTKRFADIDFPVFRLSEMYFIYAEAHLRGGGGTATTALDYLNRIRFRAYGQSYGPSNVGMVTAGDLNLQFILDERARELYWEGHRRTDLIRYDQLTTGTYLWPWKGGVASGTAVDPKYNIYAIPASNRVANPNLEQNPGF